MKIRLLLVKGCPSRLETLELLQSVLDSENIVDPVEVVEIHDSDTALRERFFGSPSIQINGLDIEMVRRGNMPCYACRIYQTNNGKSGIPTGNLILEAIHRALAPNLKILFLCTGNSCRSQMAEGWARHLKGDLLEPFSAGIETRGIDPLAVKVMSEAGVDISGQTSKNVSEFINIQNFDYVITVCSNVHDTCPVFQGRATVIHKDFDDPPALTKNLEKESDVLEEYRRVRDEIRSYIETLPDILQESAVLKKNP